MPVPSVKVAAEIDSARATHDAEILVPTEIGCILEGYRSCTPPFTMVEGAWGRRDAGDKDIASVGGTCPIVKAARRHAGEIRPVIDVRHLSGIHIAELNGPRQNVGC